MIHSPDTKFSERQWDLFCYIYVNCQWRLSKPPKYGLLLVFQIPFELYNIKLVQIWDKKEHQNYTYLLSQFRFSFIHESSLRNPKFRKMKVILLKVVLSFFRCFLIQPTYKLLLWEYWHGTKGFYLHFWLPWNNRNCIRPSHLNQAKQ